MQAYFALVLHAHLPFVRHPEHEKSLEETWLFEALTETYLPLLLLLEQWKSEGINAPITLTLSPTLCAMLQDPLLCGRYARHLDELFELAEKEVHRTSWEPRFHRLAVFYHERFGRMRQYYESLGGDLIKAFRRLQDAGALEIITTAATHAVLPLLLDHPASVRAQVLVARDDYPGVSAASRAAFGCPNAPTRRAWSRF
jgi:1,4-alpha-glucan branching enzyme